jgi:hypothetical protein
MARLDLVDEVAAAKYIAMSVAFLRAARCHGRLGHRTPPPPHLQLGRAIRYAISDLDAWLAARRVDPAATRSAALVPGVSVVPEMKPEQIPTRERRRRAAA